MKRTYCFLIVFILFAGVLKGQDKPVGYWDSYLPYNSSLGMATDGSTIFNICNQGFYTFNPTTNVTETYSKVNGMSDIGMACVGYDAATSMTVLVYKDCNIDLFKNNTFYNIPDLKLKTISGTKAVYHVYTENGTAYLSTSIGVVVVDLASHNILQTYQFTVNGGIAPVKDFIGVGDSFYAVTGSGLFRANKNNSELQDFAVWQLMDSNKHVFNNIAAAGNSVFLSNTSTVYKIVNDTAQAVFVSDSTIEHIDGYTDSLFITMYIRTIYSGKVKVMEPGTCALIDSIPVSGIPVQTLKLSNSQIWISDSYRGLERRFVDTGRYQAYYDVPAGPDDEYSFDIYANNGDLWVAHGGFNDKYGADFNRDGFSHLNNGNWTQYSLGVNIAFDTVHDICTIAKDEKDGTIYAGSFLDGLVVLKTDKTLNVLKQNSIFDSSVSYFGAGQKQIIGSAFDANDNLWLSSFSARDLLYVRTPLPDSSWYKFYVPGVPNGGPLAIDDNGQVWVACAYGGGALVYNANGTLTDPTDDKYYKLSTGVGNGNLPSNTVYCVAKDKNNNIWIGTDNGIGIVSNCYAPFTGTPPCDAQIPIVQYDQYAGYLFAGSNVRTIAVDGANRKWVGTDAGVWLLSPDASQIVYRFTQDNSPLPSDHIEKITVDPVTGEVYVGTDQGLVSYRSTATDGNESNSNVLIFPDPVPSGYSGTIAIKGLTANADVRITDVTGQLVYRTKALGGQAVWNGVDYKGHRPQSGVYLVFASSSDGSQVYSGKMVFLQ